MKILIITQKIDSKDPVLGFFHDWVDKLSYHFDKIEVMCLEKGVNLLPKNVTVHSLGREIGGNRFTYIMNFWKTLMSLDGAYDKVFVHMNQEYVLMGGFYWLMKNKPIFFWRNHSKGNFLTNISIYFSSKVFCTSKDSYTAKFKKTVIMPAGINTQIFKIGDGSRKKYSVCMVGRISPVKHIDVGLEVIRELISSGVQVSLGIIGPVLDDDKGYYEDLKRYVNRNNISSFVSFLPPVSPDKLSLVYNDYQICLNLTDTGSFDKTIVEASSCGVVPLVTNSSMKGLLPDECITESSKESIKVGIKKLLDDHVRISLQKSLDGFVKSQSLENLISKLVSELK